MRKFSVVLALGVFLSLLFGGASARAANYPNIKESPSDPRPLLIPPDATGNFTVSGDPGARFEYACKGADNSFTPQGTTTGQFTCTFSQAGNYSVDVRETDPDGSSIIGNVMVTVKDRNDVRMPVTWVGPTRLNARSVVTIQTPKPTLFVSWKQACRSGRKCVGGWKLLPTTCKNQSPNLHCFTFDQSQLPSPGPVVVVYQAATSTEAQVVDEGQTQATFSTCGKAGRHRRHHHRKHRKTC